MLSDDNNKIGLYVVTRPTDFRANDISQNIGDTSSNTIVMKIYHHQIVVPNRVLKNTDSPLLLVLFWPPTVIRPIPKKPPWFQNLPNLRFPKSCF